MMMANQKRDEGDSFETFSQFGEDVLVWQYFNRRCEGVFVEAGAFDPVVLSQSWLLEKNGWSGVLVEPNPVAFQKLEEKRLNSSVFNCALGDVDRGKGATLSIEIGNEAVSALVDKPASGNSLTTKEVTVDLRTLNSILEEAGISKVDYFSLDVEGFEVAAMKGFDFAKYRPDLVLIEDHVQDLSRDRFLRSQGYRCVMRTGCNSWYVPKGTRFALAGLADRWKVFRKLYLGTPFRKFKYARQGRKLD